MLSALDALRSAPLPSLFAAAIMASCAVTGPAIAEPPDAAPTASAAATASPPPPPLPSPQPTQAAQPPPAPAAPPPKQKQAYVVAAMGDSLTDARSHGGKFLDVVRGHCPESRFDNYGKGGQMVNQMRKRFARDVLGEPAAAGAAKPKYTHVIIFGGVNDLYSDLTAGRTVAKIQADLSQMYEAARKRGILVVALAVAPWGGFSRYYNASRAAATHKLNQWLLGLQQAGEVDAVIDTYSLLSCGDPERLCPAFTAPFNDGLHFNEQGHRKLGQLLYEKVFADCR